MTYLSRCLIGLLLCTLMLPAIGQSVTFGGTVVDNDGNPVEGARVYYYRQFVEGKWPRVRDEPVFTDAAGKWSVQMSLENVKIVVVGVSHPQYLANASGNEGYVPLREVSLAEAQSGMLRHVLKRGTLVRGQVLNRQQLPVVDAAVSIGGLSLSSNALPPVLTDGEGFFELAVDPDAPLRLGVKADGYGAKIVAVAKPSPDSEIFITLNPPKSLSGKVVDKQGRPIAAAIVRQSQLDGDSFHGPPVRSDEQGSFTLEGVTDGTISLGVSAKGFVPEHRYPVPTDGPLTVTLANAANVTLTVVDDATGEPVNEFQVRYGLVFSGHTSASWQDGDLRTEEGALRRGRAATTVELPKNQFRDELDRSDAKNVYRVVAPGYATFDTHALGPADGSQQIEVRLKPAKLTTGTVLAADGTPTANAKVFVYEASSFGRGSSSLEPPRGYSLELTTDAAGRFQASLPSPPLNFVIMNEQGITISPAYLSTEELNAKPLVFRIKPFGAIKGQVFSGTKPLASASVSANLSATTSFGRSQVLQPVSFFLQATTDSDGRFELPKVIAGRWTLSRSERVGRYGYPVVITEVEVQPGNTTAAKLGGTGRKVIAKWQISPDVPSREKLLPHAAFVNYKLTVPRPPTPDLPPEVLNDGLRLTGAILKYLAQPGALRFTIEQEIQNQRRYPLVARPNGSISIEGVQPGAYEITIQFFEQDGRGIAIGGGQFAEIRHEFVMPLIPGGVSDEPLDLGILTAKAVKQE